jgi:hypothetical protein
VKVLDPASTRVSTHPQSKSKFILRPTVSRPVRLGTKHPFGAYDQILDYCQTFPGLLMRSVLSDERTDLSFAIVTGPQSFSGPSPLRLATIFYCLSFETSLFVASYDSLGHGGGIRPRLHTGYSGTSYNSSARTTHRTHLLLPELL